MWTKQSSTHLSFKTLLSNTKPWPHPWNSLTFLLNSYHRILNTQLKFPIITKAKQVRTLPSHSFSSTSKRKCIQKGACFQAPAIRVRIQILDQQALRFNSDAKSTIPRSDLVKWLFTNMKLNLRIFLVFLSLVYLILNGSSSTQLKIMGSYSASF